MQLFTAKEYVKIDIANSYGLDKKTWTERLRWFDRHEHQLHELIASAESPAMFYAGVLAWEDAQAGVSSGHMISLDATASGLQLLAALTSDRSAAQMSNVVTIGDLDERGDAYTLVYEDMLAAVRETARIERDDVKQSVMTSLYGSTAMPKRVFGEGRLLDVFYATMRRMAPAAWELNEAFLAMWDPEALVNSWVLPDNFHVHVKVMDRTSEVVHFLNKPYEIHRKVNAPVEQGRSLGANVIHSIDGMIVRELGRRCDYDRNQVEKLRTLIDSTVYQSSPEVVEVAPGHERTEDDQMVTVLWDNYQESGFLSARIIDHLNADNILEVDENVVLELLDSLPEKPFKVVSIHQWWI